MGFFEWLFSWFDPLRDLIFPWEKYRGSDRARVGSGARLLGGAVRERRILARAQSAQARIGSRPRMPNPRMAAMQRGFTRRPQASRLAHARMPARAILPANSPKSHFGGFGPRQRAGVFPGAQKPRWRRR